MGGGDDGGGTVAGAPVTVIKLGGSVLTRKSEAERLRPKVLHRLAEEVGAVWDGERRPMVLLHGAGAFGHPPAQAWGLARPPPGRANRERGAALTAYGVRRLHVAVLRALLDAGLPARSLPPYPTWQNREGRLRAYDVAPFRDALGRGSLPVSFGDVVADAAWGSSILSADTLAVTLARELPAPRVLFVSDVPGVLVPGNRPQGEVLRELGPTMPPTLLPAPDRPDVTGGIRGKVDAMLAIAALGARAGLISGLQHGALARAIRGEDVHGTWTRAAPIGGGRGGLAPT